MKKEDLDKELQEHAPFLSDLKQKGDGFKVPEAYFDGLEDAVFARLEASGDAGRPKIKVVKRPLLSVSFIRPKAAMAYAAAMVLVLTAVWFFRQPATVQPLPYVSVELTEDELETYVLENLNEFEPEQLVALTPEAPNTMEETIPGKPGKNLENSNELHPDDLDKILDEMTDEELEQIL
jgi:hypothetical protein